MKAPRKRTPRGVKYDALAHGYRILKSPLAQSFEAAADHFEERDQSNSEDEKTIQKRPVEANG
jgi:hypothetical protein